MTETSERILIGNAREGRVAKLQKWSLVAVPLVAILFQVYVPRFFEGLAYLELPLLVTVYFSLVRRNPISGIFVGASIGLVQDSLSNHPLGLFGIVKTLVGYFAASIGLRFDVEHVVMRFLMGFFFYIFHEFFQWVLVRALLDKPMDFNIQHTAILGLLNAAVAIPLFHVLDKLKERN